MTTLLSSKTQRLTTNKAEYVLSPDVIVVPVQDETVRLLNMSGQFHAVSAVGAKMLQETLEQVTAVAVRRIASQYGVDARQVQMDLDVFLRELERQQLIRRHPSRRRIHRLSTTLTSLLLSPALGCIHLCARSLKAKAWCLLILARFSFRLFGWTRTLTAWQRYCPKVCEHDSIQQREEIVKAVDEAVRAAAVGHLLTMECKERALCCWSLLHAAGVPATLVVGINLFPFAGHCWCESGPWTLSDYADRCEIFTTVMRYE